MVRTFCCFVVIFWQTGHKFSGTPCRKQNLHYGKPHCRWKIYFSRDKLLHNALLVSTIKIQQNNLFLLGMEGSSTVKVPGDVLPARVCFLKLFILAKGILLPILVHLVWARVCFFAILVQSKTSVIPVRNSIFFKFWFKRFV